MADRVRVRFTFASRLFYELIRLAALGAAKLVGRVEVHGREHVPDTGPFILAPVHRSNVDFVLSSVVTKRAMHYMVKDSVWKSKMLGAIVSFGGSFPVRRGSADREALRSCVALLDAGEPLVMFPEGTRREGPVVEDVFDGPAYLAIKTGAPLIPVGIGGSAGMMPKGSKMVRPHKIVLVVGEPIRPPVAPEGTRATSRHAVRALTEELTAAVQKLFDDAQARAGD